MLHIGNVGPERARYEMDSNALTTHGICVGMTGSGKTGLCITLIEELRLAGIPTLIIDPKGDMGNLALAFDDLSPSSFLPWIDSAKASRDGKTPEQTAEETAAIWANGLAKEGITASQIRQMNQNSPVTLFTPGSSAGVPLNILSGLEKADTDDPEIEAELIKTAVNALLGLIDVSSNPLTGKEFILLSNILDFCWDKGEPADLDRIISYVQNPPFKRVGIFAVDAFYPPNKRMELALKLNGLVASPDFRLWMQGAPIDGDSLLFDENQKPRCSVLYLAHLQEKERQFVIALVASRLLTWMRKQAGRDSLRALVFIDEVAGMIPPHPYNPPTKTPLVTLFKQARAFGLGMVVATQNPMDLDYKVFSNAGVWMIGKLSTDNDRRRVVEGLKGAPGVPANLGELIAGLGKREFFIRNIHEAIPHTVKSRFAMSFLRGPLTKQDVAALTKSAPGKSLPPEPMRKTQGLVQPAVISGVKNLFLAPEALRDETWREVFRVDHVQKNAKEILYVPAYYSAFQVRFDDTKARVIYDEVISRIVFPLTGQDRLPPVDDDLAPLPDLTPELTAHPLPDSRFMPLPAFLDDAAEFENAERDFSDYLFRKRTLPLYFNPELKLYSRPGESEDEFTARCEKEAMELFDDALEKAHGKLDRDLARLETKSNRIAQQIGDADHEARARDMESMAGALESVAGFLFGRRRSIGRAISGTMTKRRMADKVKRRRDNYESGQQEILDQIDALKEKMEQAREQLRIEFEKKGGEILEYPVAPERSDIHPVESAIVWIPVL